MLFMLVYSWTPDRRDAIIKRRLEKGPMNPKGVKIVGEWTAMENRDFCLVEAADPKLLTQTVLAWNDILSVEVHMVLDTEKDLLGLLKK
jgi:hypothetical protein